MSAGGVFCGFLFASFFCFVRFVSVGKVGASVGGGIGKGSSCGVGTGWEGG